MCGAADLVEGLESLGLVGVGLADMVEQGSSRRWVRVDDAVQGGDKLGGVVGAVLVPGVGVAKGVDEEDVCLDAAGYVHQGGDAPIRAQIKAAKVDDEEAFQVLVVAALGDFPRRRLWMTAGEFSRLT